MDKSNLTAIIGTAITVLTFCGGLFGYVINKLLRNKEVEIVNKLTLERHELQIKELEKEVRDLHEYNAHHRPIR